MGFRKERIYQNTCCCCRIKTKEILALEVTDEKVHDSKMMKKLVENVLKIKPNKKKIKSLLGDGANDFNDNFRVLNEKKIDPIIKVKRNSAVILSRNNMNRNKESRQQKTKDKSNGKRKKDMDIDGWLKKLLSWPSKECLMANI